MEATTAAGAGLLVTAVIADAGGILHANPAHAAQSDADERDRLAADQHEREFLKVVSPESALVDYDRQLYPAGKRAIFVRAFEELLIARDIGDMQGMLPTLGRSMPPWRTILVSLLKQLTPGGVGHYASMLATTRKMGAGSSAYPPYDENRADERAKAFLRVAQELSLDFVPADSGNFLMEPPHVQARILVTALGRLQEKQAFPRTWDLYLSDKPQVGLQFFVKTLLGENSVEFRNWDRDQNPRNRGDILRASRRVFFEKAALVLSDPPGMDLQRFKNEINFIQWQMYDPSNEHYVVGAAFGKDASRRFQELRAGERNATLGPEQRRELDDLYRGAVVMTAAAYMTLNMLL
jgi:hypothetical protein